MRDKYIIYNIFILSLDATYAKVFFEKLAEYCWTDKY